MVDVIQAVCALTIVDAIQACAQRASPVHAASTRPVDVVIVGAACGGLSVNVDAAALFTEALLRACSVHSFACLNISLVRSFDVVRSLDVVWSLDVV